MSSAPALPSATIFKDNPYQEEWADRDFLHSADGPGEFPRHMCKLTYLLSKPFIKNFRNAVDVGCRVGEFTRYLHRDFDHVFAFDPRLWPRFSYNVDLGKVTHFTCALGDEACDIQMFGGGHREMGNAAPSTVKSFTLDMFELKDVDYIKIDVEGFEKKVLLGAAGTIERDSPLIVVEQNHVCLEGEDQYSAKAYLESIGYRQVAVDTRGYDFVMARD